MDSLIKVIAFAIGGCGMLLSVLILYFAVDHLVSGPKFDLDQVDQELRVISEAILNEWVEQGELPSTLAEIPELAQSLQNEDWNYQPGEGFLVYTLDFGNREDLGWVVRTSRSILWKVDGVAVAGDLKPEFADLQKQGEEVVRTILQGVQAEGDFRMEAIGEILNGGWFLKANRADHPGEGYAPLNLSSTRTPGQDGIPYLEISFPPPYLDE